MINKDGDKRRINKIWDFCNHLGEWFTFGLVGSGKNSVVVTLNNGGGCLPEPTKQNLLHTVYKWKDL